MSAVGMEEVCSLEEIGRIKTLKDYSDGEVLEIIAEYEDGSIVISIPDEYPDEKPSFSPSFEKLDDKVIKMLLDCAADNFVGEEMILTVLDEFEKDLCDLRESQRHSELVRSSRTKNEDEDDREIVWAERSKVAEKAQHRETSSSVSKRQKIKMKVFVLPVSFIAALAVNYCILLYKSQVSKSRFQTALDVIHRIQWDEQLNEDEFIVGYIDRFTGIREKPFSDFSWKHIADVDYEDEFCVPQHRIHFFKWKAVIVWNRDNRIDYVFGSGEGNGRTISDVMAEYHLRKSTHEN